MIRAAIRYLGPDTLRAVFDDDNPRREIELRLDAHAADATNETWAWREIERVTSLHHEGEIINFPDVIAELHWRDCIMDDPMPPWALSAALDAAADSDRISVEGRNRGRTFLAESMGVSVRTVHRWISGDVVPPTSQARLIVMLVRDALGGRFGPQTEGEK